MRLDELKSLAEKATPGPWKIDKDIEVIAPRQGITGGAQIIVPYPDSTMCFERDREFIASLDPTTALKLIGLLMEARESCEMGAFHHDACRWLKGEECSCAYKKVDKFLRNLAAFEGGEK